MTLQAAPAQTAPINPLLKRRAGVLAHITSLPGPLGNGDFSHDAYRFVDFAVRAGFSIWQVLPLNPTHDDGSPYYSTSANAGNPLLISLDWLVDRGWLAGYERGLGRAEAREHRAACLRQAHEKFIETATADWLERYRRFCREADHWLEDYVRFVAFDAQFQSSWTEWPAAVRDRKGAAYDSAVEQVAERCEFERFAQFIFAMQWTDLRAYANDRGLYLFGDLPIFVAHHSADVWARPALWKLDKAGQPTVVAGVPPDYFSKTGQLWGNPLYRWPEHRKQGYDWWLQRLARQRELFDLLRIDHFRGLEACWEIPAGDETAVNGSWVEAPGEELLTAVSDKLGALPLVAEDLGDITPEVDELRKRFGLPGMRVMQFGFDGDPANLHLPHNYTVDSVAYTGTHDNAVTLEWFEALDEAGLPLVQRYLPDPAPMPDPLIRAIYASCAQLAIIPMQDVLSLGEGNRMNTPGTLADDNWCWRFEWSELAAVRTQQLAALARLYNR